MTERYVPPAVVPPRGLAGIIEGYDPNAELDLSKFPKNMVLLNVYDVSDSELLQKINKFTTANNQMLIGGVFHGGVEVYGKEWSYGFTEDNRSGVSAVWPRSHPQHSYRATVPMGTTDCDEEKVKQILLRLMPEWPGNVYDLIHCNCLSFCNGFLQELGLRRVPGWVDRAARAASAVDVAKQKISTDTRQAIQLVRTVTSDLEERARGLTEDEGLHTLRRQSIEAASTAAEEARSRAQELAGHAQKSAHAFGASLRLLALGKEGDGEKADDGGGDGNFAAVDTAALGRRASEIGDQVGARAQQLTGRLFQWGQDLGLSTSVGASTGDGDKEVATGFGGYGGKLLQQAQENLNELGANAQPIFDDLGATAKETREQVRASMQENLNGLSEKAQPILSGLTDLLGDIVESTGASPTTLGAEPATFNRAVTAEDSDEDERGTHGMVRAVEDKMLAKGLLDEEDDDLISFEADTQSRAATAGAFDGGQAQASRAAPWEDDDEAPADWMTSPVEPTPMQVPKNVPPTGAAPRPASLRPPVGAPPKIIATPTVTGDNVDPIDLMDLG